MTDLLPPNPASSHRPLRRGATFALAAALLLRWLATAAAQPLAPPPAPPPAAAVAPTAPSAPAPAPLPALPTAAAKPAPPTAAAKPAPPTAAAKPAPPTAAAKPPTAAAGKPGKPLRPPPPPPPSAYEVLFTFDDGPRLDTTPKVLDTLDQYAVKAVFFVNGVRFSAKRQERERELMRETVKRGHIIGNHTIHHYFLCGKRGPVVGEHEITDNAAMITEAIGQPPLLFRTPFGSHCASLSATLQKLNIHPIGWDVDPQDWKLQDADKIYDFMVNALRTLRRPRSILLFHDVQPATVAMLPRLLKWITEENTARRARKQPEIKIIDYHYLLTTTPPGAAAPSRPG